MASWVQAYNPIKATRGSAFPCQPTCHGSSQVHARRYLTSTLSRDPSFVFTFPCRRGVYKVTRLAALNGLKGGVRTTNLFSFRLVHRRFLLSPQWYTRVWRIRRGFTCRYAQPRFPRGCIHPFVSAHGIEQRVSSSFSRSRIKRFFSKRITNIETGMETWDLERLDLKVEDLSIHFVFSRKGRETVSSLYVCTFCDPCLTR